MKICTKCKTKKPLDDFAKDKRRPDCLTIWCKICRNAKFKEWYCSNPEKVNERRRLDRQYRKDYYQSPERKKKYRIKYIESTFGIPYAEYDRMYADQNGLCAICGKPETSSKCKYLSVDHNHETGHIRGLLCVSCNRGIGMFWDNTQLLEKAIHYLRQEQSCS